VTDVGTNGARAVDDQRDVLGGHVRG
jgi:hypothetical protein